MPALRIVEAFDEVKDGVARLRVGFEAAPIQQLAFQRGEETLRHRIVVAVTDRAHRWPHARLAAAVAELDRRILRALIRVMNNASRTAHRQRHAQRVQHDRHVQRGRHRPTNDPATEDIEHDRQIQEAHPRRDIRDISDPQHIRRIRRERTVDQIGRLPPAVAHRRHHELAPADADNVRLTHYPRDAVPAGRNALRSKLGMNAWRTVGSA